MHGRHPSRRAATAVRTRYPLENNVTVSSRTPEGYPSHCPLCGAATNLDFSEPTGDAPCPNCGQLLWRSAQLLDEFQHYFGERLRVPIEEINSQMPIDDLRADSLDVVEFVMQFEERFGGTIPDEDYEQIRTIADAIRCIQQRERGG